MYVNMLTAREGLDDLVAGLEAGADDYIVRPFHAGELQARIRVAIRVATLQERLTAGAPGRKAHDQQNEQRGGGAATGAPGSRGSPRSTGST